ncbi:hypothetical protein SAMN02746089_00625 [Caldanaerobius fijiensis DSM 17918]|uniref:Uncharacterized protein n=1 Tax=Caldanaerobius fijiensis DSM 17918 TaxID=1121256 RepID=A0A1M4VHE5_9THEO|nr:hypothetical protein [Caldanaerobius fijiensis]SHE68223.1 hypothetical protein SAMN02746089_00625 [Caldanaerobius fijiensis DSM 17918]
MATINRLYDKKLRKLKLIENNLSNIIGRKINNLEQHDNKILKLEFDDGSTLNITLDDDGHINYLFKKSIEGDGIGTGYDEYY